MTGFDGEDGLVDFELVSDVDGNLSGGVEELDVDVGDELVVLDAPAEVVFVGPYDERKMKGAGWAFACQLAVVGEEEVSGGFDLSDGPADVC